MTDNLYHALDFNIDNKIVRNSRGTNNGDDWICPHCGELSEYVNINFTEFCSSTLDIGTGQWGDTDYHDSEITNYNCPNCGDSIDNPC